MLCTAQWRDLGPRLRSRLWLFYRSPVGDPRRPPSAGAGVGEEGLARDTAWGQRSQHMLVTPRVSPSPVQLAPFTGCCRRRTCTAQATTREQGLPAN